MSRTNTVMPLTPLLILLSTITTTTYAFHNPLKPRQDIASPASTLPTTTSVPSQAPLLLPTLSSNFSTPLSNSSAQWLSQYLLSSYIFPTTVLQIPVATVCPYPSHYSVNGTTASNASSSNRLAPNIPAFAYITFPSLISPVLNISNSTNGTNTNLIPLLPSANPTVTAYNATVHLPNGQTTTFLSRTLATPDTNNVPLIPGATVDPRLTAYEPDLAEPTSSTAAATVSAAYGATGDQGRIVQGDDGCQTLFSALTTSVCSTSVAVGGGVGLGPVVQIPVTDCGQWVRFSSASALAPAACSSTTTATIAGVGRRDDSLVGDVVDSGATTAYFAALWHDLVRAQASGTVQGVPRVVSVETCLENDSGGIGSATESCWYASTEMWTLSSVTKTKVVTSVASFSGVSLHFSSLCLTLLL